MRVRHFIKFQRPSLRLFNRIDEHALRWVHSSDQALCERAIVRLASSQQDGDKSSLSICEYFFSLEGAGLAVSLKYRLAMLVER